MPPINRRTFLSGLLGAATGGAFLGQRALTGPPVDRPLIGAIRWDAWYDPANGHVAQAVEKSLGPAEFHYRMPFFGQETGPDRVRINGDSQEIIDKEIALASAAGLDYWAYCTYAPEDPMSNALHLHLSSTRRQEIGFCIITGFASTIPYFAVQTEYHLKLILEPGYTQVPGNRPLVYVLSSSDEQMQHLGGRQKVAEWVRQIRTEVQRRGGGNPYFVLSEGNPARARQLCEALDFDAVGLYATALGPFGGAPYQTLVQATEAHWDKLAATGLPLVPNIMTGWNSRPRFRNPVPWEKDKPTDPAPVEHYYQDGTPEEIARHLGDGIRWLAKNRDKAPANTALIYAWNECDEGYGALVPHYDPDNPAGNNARLEALSAILHQR